MSLYRFASATVALLLVAGCVSEDPENPEYWIKQLKSVRRAEAIKMLGTMAAAGGEKGKVAMTAVPKLLKLYEADKARSEIIPTLIQMKAQGPEVTALMATAITDANEMQAAAAAADYLADTGAKDKTKELLAVLDTAMEDEVKAASLRALVKFADPATVNDLVRVLDRGVDRQWIHLNALACQALGAIGPPAANSALPSLVRGIFLRDKFNRMAFRDCAVALLRFGAPAGQALTNAIEGKDPELTKWSLGQGHVDGLIAEEAAKVLGLMGYKDAVPALVKQLVVRYEAPPKYDAKKAQIWAMIEAQRFQNAVEALGRIGDPRAIKPLSKWLFEGEYLRRIRVPVAINFIGDPAGVPELVKAATKAIVEGLGWFRIDVAEQLGYLAGAGDVAALERLVPILEKMRKELEEYKAADPAAAGGWLGKLDGFKAQIAALKECQVKAPCWTTRLEDKLAIVRNQAVWNLSRLTAGDPKALEALLGKVGSDDFILRNTVLDALPKVCDKRCLDIIEKVKKKEAGKARYKGFRDRFLFVMTQIAAKG